MLAGKPLPEEAMSEEGRKEFRDLDPAHKVTCGSTTLFLMPFVEGFFSTLRPLPWSAVERFLRDTHSVHVPVVV